MKNPRRVDIPAHAASTDLPVSIVLPLFNEDTILQQTVEALARVFDRLVGPGNWLFIFVDNGSIDRTPQIIEEAVRRWPLSRGVRLDKPNIGEAIKTGLRTAETRWTYVIEVDQWDLPFLAWAWRKRNEFDVFIASKRADPTINNQHIYRRLLSCGLNALLQVFVEFTGTDTHGTKLINTSSLRDIILKCQLDRGQFDTELILRAARAAKRIVEVPVEYREKRPPRNLMVKKIVWNLLALRRLIGIMKTVPFDANYRYYRFAREDVLADSRATLAEIDMHMSA